MSDESFKAYIEKRLPRTDDRELLNELVKAFEENGGDGLKKHVQDMISQMEEG